MKITDIIAYPVWVGQRNQLIVKVETDEGVYGWGESGVSGRELAVAGAVRHFREFLVGKDPMRRGALWQEMYRSQYFEGGRILAGAISAIDIALYDIAGKALGIPVYQLLGGKHRDYVPCFATTNATMGPPLIDEVNMLLSEGWDVIRTMPGEPRRHPDDDDTVYEPRETIGITSTWLAKLREAVGPDPVLGIDYHCRLSVAETVSFCQRMPAGTLDFLEEPIRDESPEAYESLRTMVDVPLAIGEEFASKWAFVPFVERGLTNYARIDVCNVGGLTESMKVAAMAEAHYIDLMPHNPLGPICTAATIHLAAAVPNFAWMEIRNSSTEQVENASCELFPVQPQQQGARFAVPDTPGLGVEFNEKLAAKQTFRFWEAPHWRRRDGSYTNW